VNQEEEMVFNQEEEEEEEEEEQLEEYELERLKETPLFFEEMTEDNCFGSQSRYVDPEKLTFITYIDMRGIRQWDKLAQLLHHEWAKFHGKSEMESVTIMTCWPGHDVEVHCRGPVDYEDDYKEHSYTYNPRQIGGLVNAYDMVIHSVVLIRNEKENELEGQGGVEEDEGGDGNGVTEEGNSKPYDKGKQKLFESEV